MFGLRRRPKRQVIVDQYPNYRKRKPCRLRYLLLLVLSIAVGTLAWHSAQAEEVARSQEVVGQEQRIEDVQAGQLLFKGEGSADYHSSLLLHSDVQIQVSGLIAHSTLKQTFRNDSSTWVEGVYVFPLPDDGAVSRLRIKIGERVIEGSIKEKQAARKIYQAAKASGRKAGLVEQQRPNMFTTRIANIPPGEKIVVELEFLQPVQYDQGRFSLRFPMTITPRYIPGSARSNAPGIDRGVENRAEGREEARQENSPAAGREQNTSERVEPVMLSSFDTLQVDRGTGWALNTDQVPDASTITPWLSPLAATDSAPVNPISISATIDMGMPLKEINSAYHAIELSREKNHYALRLAKDVVSMEQDFVLSWSPLTGSAPAAALFSETVDGDEYIMMMVLPPQQQSTASRLPKEVIYIVDTSGSMDGVSIRQAKRSLLLALDRLQPSDSFNVIEFNSVTRPLFSKAQAVDSQSLQRARSFVKGLSSGGGTEMLSALKVALRKSNSEQSIRQVIFITDGAVGNEAALFQEIHLNLGASRLFTVGIGSAPNSHFMRKAAQFGRGTFTHIGSITEVQEKMSALFAKLDSPVVTNIKIRWPDKDRVEMYPRRIPDLYQGEPLLLSAKIPSSDASVQISGIFAGAESLDAESSSEEGSNWSRTLPLNNSSQQRGVSTLWAREKIASLLDEKIAGRDPQGVRKEVLSVALAHQIMSPYTSFVAVEKEVSRPALQSLESKNVANARPKGQGPQAYAYPKTATAAPLKLVVGVTLLLLACAWVVCLPRRDDLYESF